MAKHYTFGWKTVDRVYAKTGGRCFYCDCVLPEDNKEYDDAGRVVESSRNWHVDHKTPLSRGGDHSIENLVPACRKCNMAKMTMTANEFVGVK